MAREPDLDGGSEDADLASLWVVDEHGFAQPEVGGDALAALGRAVRAVQEDTERVASRALVDAEDPQQVESRHGPNATLPRALA